MPAFNAEAFQQFVLESGVIGFFDAPLTLKSGRKSHWYVNWRTASSDVYLLDKATDFVLSFVDENKLKPDCFFGVPEGATKLGILTQYKWAKANSNFQKGSHSLPMGRGKVKTHGAPSDKFFVGAPQGNIILLEDVTTTGGSLLDVIRQFHELNLPVIAAISLTNRMVKRDDGHTVREAVEALGVPYFYLSDAASLLTKLIARQNPGQEILRSIEAEFEQYGEQPLRF